MPNQNHWCCSLSTCFSDCLLSVPPHLSKDTGKWSPSNVPEQFVPCPKLYPKMSGHGLVWFWFILYLSSSPHLTKSCARTEISPPHFCSVDKQESAPKIKTSLGKISEKNLGVTDAGYEKLLLRVSNTPLHRHTPQNPPSIWVKLSWSVQEDHYFCHF